MPFQNWKLLIVGLWDSGTSFFAWRIFRGHISLYDLDPHAVQAEVSFGLLGSRKESKAVCHWKKTHLDIHKLRDKLVDFQLESDKEQFFLHRSANFCFFRDACWMDTEKGMYEELFPSKWVLQRLEMQNAAVAKCFWIFLEVAGKVLWDFRAFLLADKLRFVFHGRWCFGELWVGFSNLECRVFKEKGYVLYLDSVRTERV